MTYKDGLGGKTSAGKELCIDGAGAAEEGDALGACGDTNAAAEGWESVQVHVEGAASAGW